MRKTDMATSAIEGVLMPGLLRLASNSRNSGITVYKTGYHGPRNWLKANHPTDYSIQLPADLQGPGDEGAGADWSFDDARLHGDYKTIAKFSRLLYEAGQRKDPRAYPLREFQGNIDSDRTVEGWSFYREHAITTSDTSHLWHIHFSVWRKYINDADAMRSILSILSGKQEEEDMPTSKEIWTEYQLAAPEPFDSTDHRWQPETFLRKIAEGATPQGKRIAAIEDKVEALDAKLDAILAALTPEPPTP
jgi:hypothetical protein